MSSKEEVKKVTLYCVTNDPITLDEDHADRLLKHPKAGEKWSPKPFKNVENAAQSGSSSGDTSGGTKK